MITIDVGIHIRAPIEQVWELPSDHEGYTFAWQVNSVKLET